MSNNLKTWPEVVNVGFTEYHTEIPEYEECIKGGYYVSENFSKDGVKYIRLDIAKEREEKLIAYIRNISKTALPCDVHIYRRTGLKDLE